ncbi:phage tail terminator protein [Spongiibacter sp. UBA1325]|uniref:phage tail terminator protein n=1 Tax=Spongiibacter sp. UBA1325 TaxID=1947543 RepID=UPI00257CAFF4|nr:hypothetical protein [Spongiibacter sp. UBA1325]|tara:strand:+ start:256 stop:699 length:444 start_codon:yes stop_codon:yes gene_type:complete
MLGSDVEARLANIAAIKDIQGAAGFAALRKNGKLKVPNITPTVFVVPLREVPADDLHGTQTSVLQNRVYHIAVITVVRVANDSRRERTNALMDEVRAAIKHALYGWTPPGFDTPFTRGPSQLFDFSDAAHWHQDEYLTDRYEEPSSD